MTSSICGFFDVTCLMCVVRNRLILKEAKERRVGRCCPRTILILQCPLNWAKVYLVGALLNWTQSCPALCVLCICSCGWLGLTLACGVSADLFSGSSFSVQPPKRSSFCSKTAVINMQRVAFFF